MLGFLILVTVKEKILEKVVDENLTVLVVKVQDGVEVSIPAALMQAAVAV